MVRRIVWTRRAQMERIEILAFWKEHNQSRTYSKKLNELIKKSLQIISRYPMIGKPTQIKKCQSQSIEQLSDYLRNNSAGNNSPLSLGLKAKTYPEIE